MAEHITQVRLIDGAVGAVNRFEADIRAVEKENATESAMSIKAHIAALKADTQTLQASTLWNQHVKPLVEMGVHVMSAEMMRAQAPAVKSGHTPKLR